MAIRLLIIPVFCLALLTAASMVKTPRTDLSKIENPILVIVKSKRVLRLFDGKNLVRTYSAALGFESVGNKEVEGDGRTPEGEFYVFVKNPKSKFYLSLGISYPGREDAERGLRENLISNEEFDEINSAIGEKRMPLQKTKLGGEIYIHGGGNANDWTDGCVALSNEDMDELFQIVPIGAKVSILP